MSVANTIGRRRSKGRFEDDRRRRGAGVGALRMATAAENLIDTDDRIVDDHADRENEARDDDGIERRTEAVEDQQGGDQRQGQGHQADQPGSPVAEEGKQHDRGKEEACEQGQRDVANSLLDERRRPEDLGVDRDAAEPRAQRFECSLDRPGHFDGVGIGELLDNQHQTGPIVDDSVADQQLVVLNNIGDVAQADDSTAGILGLDPDLGKFVGGADREHVLDTEALVGRVDEPARPRRRAFEERQR